MKITEITVSAGRVLAHPTESYSNLRPHVTLKAVLDDGEDAAEATRLLQAKAEGLVEDHANQLTEHIKNMYYLSEREKEAQNLEKNIRASQRRLEDIRDEVSLMLKPSADELRDELRDEQND